MRHANSRLISAALVLLSATGCGIPRATEPEPKFFEDLSGIASFAQDPKNFPAAYGMVLAAIWMVLLAIYGGEGFVRAFLNSVRLTGMICLVTAPLMFVANRDATAGLALGVSGLLALVITTVAFKKEL